MDKKESSKNNAVNHIPEPEIIGTKDGMTTIKHGNKTLRIPEKLVDKYMIEHMEAKFDEK